MSGFRKYLVIAAFGVGAFGSSTWRADAGPYVQTNLVSDLPGLAKVTDPSLVNPWGISEGPTSPFWISDSKSGLSTLYNTPGKPQALAVGIPTPGNPTGAGTSTGTVFNIAASSK